MGIRSRVGFLVCLTAVLLLTSGCWSRKELNSLSIAQGIGIDLEDNQYVLTVQIVNPGSFVKQQESMNTSIVVYSAKGATLNEAVRRLSASVARKIFFAHIRIVVFSERVAKQGIAKPLDFLMRDNEIRSDFNVVIARDSTAKEVLSVLTPLEKIPSNYLFNALEVANKEWSHVVSVKMDEVANNILGEGMDPVLSGVRILGDKTKGKETANLQLSAPSVKFEHAGIGVLKKDKLVGWLDENESRGYSLLTDRVQRTALHIPCPSGGKLGIDISHVHTQMRSKVTNNNPEIWVDSSVKGNISSVECQIDLSDLATIEKINELVSAAEKSLMELSIQKAISLGTDIFGFGIAVHRADPKFWKNNKSNWDERFEQMPIHIEVVTSMSNTGTIGKSPVTEKEE
ncbi:Ger(x)C family spore germination protein [Paenibacillus alba]|uniref:Ger(X)C family spore germination protein n=1 Tax=Paenibacillus alba TaxID=1197127 RepID=A0ABU6G5F6_9BACL|nr:Ger(x)C family spore germination protein [Paenibacillus alba]MEC0229412.1 Ger(x)C family spore germination protein [Paenibacillus alba]